MLCAISGNAAPPSPIQKTPKQKKTLKQKTQQTPNADYCDCLISFGMNASQYFISFPKIVLFFCQ